jgi:hypothetical protein
MPYAQPPPIPSPTPFWGLGFRFEIIGWRFHDISDSVETVWLIGPYLAIPFRFIGDSFYTARDLSWDANGLIQYLQQWIDGILYGDTLGQLWSSLTWWFEQLYYNPDQFVNDALNRLSPNLQSIIINANAWIQAKVIENFPFVWDLLSNPIGWVVDRLYQHFGWGVDILNDPISYIIGVIDNHLPGLGDFIRDPGGYIQDRLTNRFPFLGNFLFDPIGTIVDWMEYIAPDITDIAYDPFGWIRGKIATVMGVYDNAAMPFGVTLLHGIVHSILSIGTNALNQVSTLICDAILKFM